MKLLNPVFANFKVGGPDSYELLNDFNFKYDGLGVISVPYGFVTDLASIPNFIFWWGRGPWDYGAIPHDYGYVYKGLIIDNKFVSMTRKEIDDIFYKINLHMGQNKNSAFLMWLAVRIFSEQFWG